MRKIAVIGSGSWGMALSAHLARLGNEVKVWSFSEEERDIINNEKRCMFLPDLKLPEGIQCSTDIKHVVENVDFILHVTPSKFTRETFIKYKDYVEDKPIIICSKGFEKESLSTLDEVIISEKPNAKIGVLSGPSHAEEVSIGIPTLLVVASKNESVLRLVQNTFMCDNMRIYTSTDVKGVELGAALKNIIAFCAGAAAALELGDNTFAALITRGLSEITRLGIELGGNKETFYGLSGLGDLVVTCLSRHSRNRQAGILIGQGKSLEETKKEVGMVIESIDNIEVAYELANIHDIDVPIIDTVYKVIYKGLSPKDAVERLMTRAKRKE